MRNTGGPVLFKHSSSIDPNKRALPGVVVVKFKRGVVPSMQELFKVPPLQKDIISEANPTSMKSLVHTMPFRLDKASESLAGIYIVHYGKTVAPALMAKSLETNQDVEYAEPHYIYKVDAVTQTNDSLIAQQYALSKIRAFDAWDSYGMGSSSVVVGIVDTGVRWMHPDLNANIWHNPDVQADMGTFPYDSIGWDFGGRGDGNGNATPDNDPNEDFSSPHEHGTHVAGIVAAVANNGIGIAGVAPKCRIMAVKVSEADMTDPGGEPYIVFGFEGIMYAANHGAKVINCSWGGVGYSQFEQDVIDYATDKGALVVAAAGNDNHSTEFQTPAYYDHVLSVAATDQFDYATSFTNTSYNVSVSAPGLDIWSTIDSSGYTQLSGTSMASPCAAGVAALVASHFPGFNASQILEQVRVTSDNIDALNPGLSEMLGYGRVDAYNAMTMSSPGVEIESLSLSDSLGGNDDGVFTDGETVSVLGTATDWLAPTTNLTLTLTTSDSYVTVVNGSVQIGALAESGSYEMSKNPLSFKVNAGTPAGHIATFIIKINDGSYSDYKAFTVLLDPVFHDLGVNHIATTVTSRGNIGFNDYPNNTQGKGFVYLPDNDSILFEGAFMAGTDSDHVVDVARDYTGNEEDSDFTPLSLVSVQTPGPQADQESVSMFVDTNSVAYRVGIKVTLHTFAFKRDSTADFIILKYRIHNLNANAINNFYAGLFFDWDIGPGGADNVASFDPTYKLGYAYNTTRSPKTYAGCALLSGGKVNYMAIDNASPSTGIYSGFTKLHKWHALSGGTVNSTAGPSDISMVLSGGPVSITAGKDTVFTFVIVAGDTLQDLEKAVMTAGEMSGALDEVVNPPPLPLSATLYQNYPNPFNPNTVISFSLRDPSRVTVEVYNVIGQKIRTLAEGNYPGGGPYALSFDGEGLASGVYFVRLTAISSSQTYVESKKIVLLK